jgi:hypothetical protein
LALLLALVAGRAVTLYHSKRRSAVKLALTGKGWQGLLEVSLFAAVNIWIIEVLAYSLGLPFRLFPYPFTLELVSSIPVSMGGVVLVVSGFIFFITGPQGTGGLLAAGHR